MGNPCQIHHFLGGYKVYFLSLSFTLHLLELAFFFFHNEDLPLMAQDHCSP